MPGSLTLDILLVVVLLGYLAYGYQTGLVRSLSGILGVALGGFVAILLVPIVAGLVRDPSLRTVATLGVVIVLIIGGHALGAALGGLVTRRLRRDGIRRVDRILGALLTVIVAALVASMVGAGIGALGIPVLGQAIASSSVLRGIDTLTPDPVQAFLARLRSQTVDAGLPRIAQALGGQTTSKDIPRVNIQTPELQRAARSVVKITGNAYACGQSQSGSGFAVAPGRIVTNAHVVAGVSEPVVELRDGGAAQGRVVYFDPIGDLAVVSVPGLTVPVLNLTHTLEAGSSAVSDGYPYGGPFVSLPVGVIRAATVDVDDIYGTRPSPREIYSLAADVEEGDSGGPLLSTSGRVAGVIFAKGVSTSHAGYAITMKELAPVVAKAPNLTRPVSPGRCTRG
ncbi:MAG: Colicin production protein [Frankiales bacterium]|nr:Colicin production protein [Frankiales bacterium]